VNSNLSQRAASTVKVHPSLVTPSSPILGSADDSVALGDGLGTPLGLPGVGGNGFGNCSNTLKGCPPSTNPYLHTYDFLFDFLAGWGPNFRTYSNNSVEGGDLKSSRGFQQGLAGVCRSSDPTGPFALGTWQAARNLPYDALHSPTGVQVGGFGGTWAKQGQRVDITVKNDASLSSFLAYLSFGKHFPVLNHASGPTGTIHQEFDLSVVSPCGR